MEETEDWPTEETQGTEENGEPEDWPIAAAVVCGRREPFGVVDAMLVLGMARCNHKLQSLIVGAFKLPLGALSRRDTSATSADTIDVRRKRLGAADALVLAASVAHAPDVVHLRLGQNFLCNVSRHGGEPDFRGFEALAAACVRHAALRTLDLAANWLGRSTAREAAGVCSRTSREAERGACECEADTRRGASQGGGAGIAGGRPAGRGAEASGGGADNGSGGGRAAATCRI